LNLWFQTLQATNNGKIEVEVNHEISENYNLAFNNDFTV
jgi:hypothetical protein